MMEHTAFVPNGENRRDTAILLVGTAEEFGLPQRSIKAASGGFYITEELADLLYDESDETPDEAPAKPVSKTKKTSGNRAAKTTGTEKE